MRRPRRPSLFPYTTLFRSRAVHQGQPDRRHHRRAEHDRARRGRRGGRQDRRSEEHTSELQSRFDLVCRLLLEKKKKKNREEAHYVTATGQKHTMPANALEV